MRGGGGAISPFPYFASMIFESFRVFFGKTNLSSKNCGIFYNFNVGLFRRHPGQCGTS